MYYEESEIRRYSRKTKAGTKSEFNQIRLGSSSKFEKDEKIIVLKSTDFYDLQNQLENKNKTIDTTHFEETINELKAKNESLEKKIQTLETKNKSLNDELEIDTNKLEAKINKLENENKKLKEKLKEEDTSKFEKEITQLTAENKKLKEKLEERDNLPQIIELQEKHKLDTRILNDKIYTLTEKLSDEKDLTKKLIIGQHALMERGPISRLLNRKPKGVDLAITSNTKELLNNDVEFEKIED